MTALLVLTHALRPVCTQKQYNNVSYSPDVTYCTKLHCLQKQQRNSDTMATDTKLQSSKFSVMFCNKIVGLQQFSAIHVC